jgi:predicted phosphohydrolase
MSKNARIHADTDSLREHKLEDLQICPREGLDIGPGGGVTIKRPSLERRIRDNLYEVYAFFKLGSNYSLRERQFHYICYNGGVGSEPRMLRASELAKLDRKNKVRIVCISDTHERHESVKVPPCDIFVHCGDILFVSRKKSLHCNVKKMEAFNNWLGTLPATHKVVIAGNHDSPLEVLPRSQVNTLLSNARYLCNQAVVLESLRLFGTPYSSGISRNRAFQDERYLLEARQELHKLHENGSPVDLLCSHSNDINPFDIAVTSTSSGAGSSIHKHVITPPKAHLWGHHHNEQGSRWLHDAKLSVLSACAVIMTSDYQPVHPAMVIDFDR